MAMSYIVHMLHLSNFLRADHINNLYNTCYWLLRYRGKTEREAEAVLKVGTCTEVPRGTSVSFPIR